MLSCSCRRDRAERVGCAIDFHQPSSGYVCYPNLRWGRTTDARRCLLLKSNRTAFTGYVPGY